MAEWLKVAVLNTVVTLVTVGSNPTPSEEHEMKERWRELTARGPRESVRLRGVGYRVRFPQGEVAGAEAKGGDVIERRLARSHWERVEVPAGVTVRRREVGGGILLVRRVETWEERGQLGERIDAIRRLRDGAGSRRGRWRFYKRGLREWVPPVQRLEKKKR